MTRMAQLIFAHLPGSLLVFLCFVSHLHAERISPEFQSTTSQGHMAIIDPETRQIISEEQAKRTMEKSGRKTEWENFKARLRAEGKAHIDSTGLQEIQLRNGAVQVDLQGRFRSPLMAVRTPNQSIIITHHQDSYVDDEQLATGKE